MQRYNYFVGRGCRCKENVVTLQTFFKPTSCQENISTRMNANTEKMPLRNWLPIIGLACTAFVFNTSEFVPIGLLTDIGHDFHMSAADTGMLISVYAWVVMIMSLPLMICQSLQKICCSLEGHLVKQITSQSITGQQM